MISIEQENPALIGLGANCQLRSEENPSKSPVPSKQKAGFLPRAFSYFSESAHPSKAKNSPECQQQRRFLYRGGIDGKTPRGARIKPRIKYKKIAVE